MEVRRIAMAQLVPLLEEQLRHGSARLPVTGGSMLPMLRGGRDVVSLVRPEAEPKPGGVFLYYRENGQYVLHRLIRMKDGETCIFCGDNQWERELVPAQRIIARVDRFRRKGRWIDAEQSRGYRLYTFVWTALFPLRPIIIALRRLLGRLRRILRRDKR